eukprot:4456533-Pyramimonas_sp.AAC.1
MGARLGTHIFRLCFPAQFGGGDRGGHPAEAPHGPHGRVQVLCGDQAAGAAQRGEGRWHGPRTGVDAA